MLFMARARLLALALAAAGAAGVSGCADDASPYFGTTRRAGKDPSTFYVNSAGEPEYIDPGRVAEAIGSLFASHTFEGLSVYDPRDGHPTQGVAFAYDKSDDNRLFRFHLRKEALWSDGKRVTAHDFVFAWSRVLGAAFGSRAAPNLYVLLNAELFTRGLLRVTRSRTEVKDAPSEGAGTASVLPAGAAVRIVEVKDDKNADKPKSDHVAIALHERLPTFDPARPAPPDDSTAGAEPKPIGFVKASELMSSASVLGIRAVDDETLEIETERPAPYFLDLTCYPSLSPMRRDVIEALEKDGNLERSNRPENIVNNGAYSYGEWRFRYEIELRKNPTYWRAPELRIDRVVWTIVEDYRSSLNLYKAGDLDYIGDNTSIGLEALPFVSTKKDFLRAAQLNVYWYELNTKRPPLGDVRVRRALNMAIDKAQLVERVLRGGQIPASHFVPDYTGSGYSAQVEADRKAGTDPFPAPGKDFDPERARALLREAGYEIRQAEGRYEAVGFPSLELLYNTHEGHRTIAVALQDFWRRHLGVTATLRNEEWRVMLKSMNAGDFQLVRGGWIADYNHPQTWLDTFLSYSPQNHTGWADPEFDRMVRDAARTGDLAESIRMFRAAEKRAVDEMSKIPIYFVTRSTLVKPWVKGFAPNGRNVHLAQWLWIDPSGAAEDKPAAAPRDYPPPGRFDRASGGGAAP